MLEQIKITKSGKLVGNFALRAKASLMILSVGVSVHANVQFCTSSLVTLVAHTCVRALFPIVIFKIVFIFLDTIVMVRVRGMKSSLLRQLV